MGFDPGISIGRKLTNNEMRELFKCGNMGGMRRSKQTGTLVIISDDTKGLYRDAWKNGVLHYTGMGKLGDQILEGNQNSTLFYSNTNGIDIHLFEVMEKSIYTYRGIVKLADKPYQSMQPDNNGNLRKVWMFPVKPIVEETAITKLSEDEIVKLSNTELIRRSKLSRADKGPQKAETIIYYRDPYLKEMVKRIAKGQCQYCEAEAPFKDKNNEPYLEEHHVIRLADGGSDTIDNVVAICPNCHRRMHVLNDETDMIILGGIAAQNVNRLKRLLAYEREILK
jgi:5-methylcytosine-specific restriction protein A